MDAQITNGSPKQNAFATTLRAWFGEGCTAQIGFAAARPSVSERDASIPTDLAVLRDGAAGIDDARFWIDAAKDRNWGAAVRSVAKRLGIDWNH